LGARPFGTGLQQWFQTFAIVQYRKGRTRRCRFVALGRASLTFMWGPYAGHAATLKKPVDLILLNNSEHVLSNPSARMVSQGGSVDWFRFFWLQDYEDPRSPPRLISMSAGEGLRKLQEAQDAERTSAKQGTGARRTN